MVYQCTLVYFAGWDKRTLNMFSGFVSLVLFALVSERVAGVAVWGKNYLIPGIVYILMIWTQVNVAVLGIQVGCNQTIYKNSA
jgi:hypothetical protein